MAGARIVNVDILDDSEPLIFVQRYEFPDRAFQIFRKPESPDEPFHLSAAVTIDRELLWGVSPILFDTPSDNDQASGDEMPEVFALIYLDEENPPSHDPNQIHENGADPCVAIVYDAKADTYRCEAYSEGLKEVESFATPSLEAEIQMVACAVHDLLNPLS